MKLVFTGCCPDNKAQAYPVDSDPTLAGSSPLIPREQLQVSLSPQHSAMQPFSIIFIKNTHFPKSWHTPPVFTEIFPEHLAYILIGFWKVIFFIYLSEVL